MDFAIDASIALAWVHPGQATTASDDLLRQAMEGATIFAPSFWFLETANALLVLERRRKLTRSERRAAADLLQGLKIVGDDEWPRRAMGEISDLALAHSLSAYDACYLELALRRRIPLASRDNALRTAARRRRIPLLA